MDNKYITPKYMTLRYTDMKIFIRLVLISLLSISGCGSVNSFSEDSSRPINYQSSSARTELENKAKLLEQQGDLVGATKIYFDLASNTSEAHLRLDYDLMAISTLLRGGYSPQARRLLDNIAQQPMNPLQSLRYRIASARIMAADNQHQRALKALTMPLDNTVPLDLRAEIHLLRAKIFKQSANALEAAREYVLLDSLQATEIQRQEYHRAILDNLSSLTPEALTRLRLQPPPDILSGWMEMAFLSKTLQNRIPQLEKELNNWRQRYPGHPGTAQIAAILPTASGAAQTSGMPLELGHTHKIALLLPFTGKYEQAATAVRNGFFSAFYSDPKRQDRSIVLYDVGKTGADLMAIYNQAVQDGATVIIGPLDKADVSKLAANPEKVAVPTLALNYSEQDVSNAKQLFQFGLSPEDEARQVAERAWLAGYRKAVALVPKGAWGERVLSAFNDYWKQVDGVLLEEQSYSPNDNDFSGPLRNLLNINESEERFNRVKNIIGQKIEFTPQRRQDAEFVFMVAFPKQARQLQPQLKFHYAADLPIFATSHVYTGKPNRNTDRDMDGINFCDIPWLVEQNNKYLNLQNTFTQIDAANFSQNPRLYALGMDSYNLLNELQRLTSDPYERFSGYSGKLLIDTNRRIKRQLSWAVFKDGMPNSLETLNPNPVGAPSQTTSQIQNF